MPEPSGHGDCARVEVPCGEGADDGVKVGLEHQEVAGEGLTEALFEIILNESNESGRHLVAPLLMLGGVSQSRRPLPGMLLAHRQLDGALVELSGLLT